MAELFKIENFRYFSDHYIESGSAAGESIQRAYKAGFETIRSIELHPPFYQYCKNRFKSVYPKIELFLGHSGDWLPHLLDAPSVIFLDAHPAGPNTAGHDDLMEKGAESEFTQNKTIERELMAIIFSKHDHLVIVDDQDGINEHNRFILNLLTSRNPKYTYTLYDEILGDGIRHENKILVCEPGTRKS